MTCVSVGRGLAFGGDTFFSQVLLDISCAKKVGKYLYCCGFHMSRQIHIDIIKMKPIMNCGVYYGSVF